MRRLGAVRGEGADAARPGSGYAFAVPPTIAWWWRPPARIRRRRPFKRSTASAHRPAGRLRARAEQRSVSLHAESRCRVLPRAHAETTRLRDAGAAVGHDESRGPADAAARHANCAIHLGAVWAGLRSAPLGSLLSQPRRKECEETGGRGGGTYARGADASPLDHPTGLRPDAGRPRAVGRVINRGGVTEE